jgi:adenylate cyclase
VGDTSTTVVPTAPGDWLADAPEWAARAWRAAGFCGDRDLNATDVELLTMAERLHAVGLDGDDIVRLAQLLQLATTPLAEHVWTTTERARERDPDGELPRLADEATAAVELAMVHAFRRHLDRLDAASPGVTAGGAVAEAVAFVDLVGFTAMTIGSDDWLAAVRALEDLAFEVVPAHGARVLKLIGDEVMFVADDPIVVVQALDELARRWRTLSGMPPIRAGAAFGTTVRLPGDRLGPAVNLASRLAGAARPGGVLLCPAMAAHAADAGVALARARRRRLRGLGWIRASAIALPSRERATQRSTRGSSTKMPPSRTIASSSHSPVENHQSATTARTATAPIARSRGSRARSTRPSTSPGPALAATPSMPTAR